MTFGDESFYALSHISESLRAIAEALRYTYLQGNEHESTLRIDTRTGQTWRLFTDWDQITMESRQTWQPWQINEVKPATTPVSPSEPAGAVYSCIDCGDSNFAGDDAEPDIYPACPNCGRTSGVYKQFGGIPVAQPSAQSPEPIADELPF